MRTIKYVIVAIFLIYWQLLIAYKFTIYGVLPNFLIPYVIFLSLKTNTGVSLPIIFFLGLAFDITYPTLLGLNTISFIIMSYLVYRFHHTINKERLSVVFFCILILNFIHYFIFFLYYLFSNQVIFSSFSNILFAFLYNSVISVLGVYFFISVSKIKVTINV